MLSLPERLRQNRAWSKIASCPGSPVVLGFGGVLSGGGLIHGGAVKLLSLREAFSSDEWKFNILYLVSSTQPRFAEDLAKLCRRKGIRLVWNQNGVGYRGWAGSAAERHNAPMRRLRAAADCVIYQSKFCELSANHFLGTCPVPSEVLLNPVDLTRFCPTDLPKPLMPLRLLAMGTQNYPARVKNVIDALAELRQGGIDALLTIAGRLLWRDAESDVERHAAMLGVKDSVFRVGGFTQEEAVSIYRAHHILLHPKYKDPCPTVVAEALACGLPVVGSASGGLPEMVPDGCGRLIGVPDSWDIMHTPTGQEMARAAAEIHASLESCSRSSREAACRLFDASRWIDQHRQIMTSMLESRS